MATQEHRDAAPKQIKIAIISISDTRTPETDVSGSYLKEAVVSSGNILAGYIFIKDDSTAISRAYKELITTADVVISTGGTGIAGKDLTVPVVEALLVKPIPGFGELFRMLSFAEVGSAAMLSRAMGGLAEHNTLVFALPGSLNAVQTAWEKLLKPEINHMVFEVFKS